MSRSDGLDNPCSPNSMSLTWGEVQRLCEDEPIVKSYSDDGGNLTIEWATGETEEFAEPLDAWNAIQAMKQQ